MPLFFKSEAKANREAVTFADFFRENDEPLARANKKAVGAVLSGKSCEFIHDAPYRWKAGPS